MSIYKPELDQRAYEILSTGKSLAAICTEFKIARPTLYYWINKHKSFAQAIDKGKQASQAHWELLGYRGMLGEIKKFNPTMWMFIVRNRFREDYTVGNEALPFESIVERFVSKVIEPAQQQVNDHTSTDEIKQVSAQTITLLKNE